MDDKALTVILTPLDDAKAKAVRKAYRDMEAGLALMNDEYTAVLEKEISTEVSGEARSLRLRIQKVRIDGENWKTKEKAQYNAAGKVIQTLYNNLKEETTKKEKALKEVEEHFERIAQAKIDKLKKKRLALLEPYNVDSSFVDLGNMPEEAWKIHLTGIVAADEKIKADIIKNSDAQKKKDAQQLIFDERKELLLPYSQFHPLLDLFQETTEEEFQTLFTLMKKYHQEFNDKQTALIKENDDLREQNKSLVENTESSETNTFKKDVLFGFTKGIPISKKDTLATDKDASLGEMLGFDTPEKEEVIYNTEYDREMDSPAGPQFCPTGTHLSTESKKTDKEILTGCAASLAKYMKEVECEIGRNAMLQAINTLRGAAMIIR
jgi:hypothetical protein